MKNEIIKIAKDLEQGTITPEQAQTLLFGLFSVRQRTFTEWLRKNFQNNIDDESLWEDCNMIIDRPPRLYTSNELINFYNQYVA
jgi:hypothetical protein